MKRLITTLIVILMIGGGLYYADLQSEDGLIEDIKYIVLPDPMANNTYDEGECTHHVFELVKNDLNMIERRWGDAEHWAERAAADGYTVNRTPQEGSILQTSRGEIGHVAYVTAVDEDAIEISEMNYYEPFEVTERTIEAENIEDYHYIHPKENPRPKEAVE
ncbi:CHAP domain-containing protein [Lacicoccus alkaliphilus]|uniref:CHAP domain-containing protein n=1 Tax=Lacicoccus alkaliphilus DSM 16010 TaxID=1123231 RepID=A0A1M7E3F0_9BACL|nr:CHAP domain-containing protein [Salinicoccus alkaliphilus]SHL86264.1 CHAP domain-containing protein [Salinicoccus alkaliphilus DSM 16010]